MLSLLKELLAELRATRQAIEAQQDRWVPWSEALRRIGGNQEDAQAALSAAVAAGRVKTLEVASSGRRRVWSPDLAHVGEVRQKRRRGSQKNTYRLG